MSVQLWTWILVGITFALYFGIAIWARAGSTKEFYVAGGGVSPLANGMATAADWMSAASFISMAGLISFMGYDGSVFLMGMRACRSSLSRHLREATHSPARRAISVVEQTCPSMLAWRLCEGMEGAAASAR